MLSWNIYHGGREFAPNNLENLLDQVAEIRPDVFFSVETYGSGKQIERDLSRRSGKGTYTGIQITSRPAGDDNLWLFTRYPVTKVYPKPSGGVTTDFNFGGARVLLPNGRQVNLFTIWLPYTDPWDGYLVDENAAAIRSGLQPRHSAQDVAYAERKQTEVLTDVVQRQLPAMLAGNTDPVLIGGDFNTLPAADWAPEWSKCRNHFGMNYPFTATTTLIFAKGDVRTEQSRIVDQRMRRHGPGCLLLRPRCRGQPADHPTAQVAARATTNPRGPPGNTCPAGRAPLSVWTRSLRFRVSVGRPMALARDITRLTLTL
ncbi:endonuclease/exonuclease/phosphatase family protein [Saccharomonospora sp. NPDC046836]|uniref:endonuclease/exonuclease/phosphatase family protein n=1 Tax=Saccharomonospora sp. NPDC046836 TaxID=3156921 RepID=UPI0033D33BB4